MPGAAEVAASTKTIVAELESLGIDTSPAKAPIKIRLRRNQLQVLTRKLGVVSKEAYDVEEGCVVMAWLLSFPGFWP